MFREFEHMFYSYLASEEQILWAARAGPKKIDFNFISGIIFLLFWTGTACFWEFGVLYAVITGFEQTGSVHCFGFILPLFGLPFVCYGFYRLSKLLFLDWIVRKNTMYALTTRRVLILKGLSEKQLELESINLKNVQELKLKKFPNDKGTIEIFSSGENISGDQNLLTGKKKAEIPALESIYEVDKVFRLINENVENVKKRGQNDSRS